MPDLFHVVVNHEDQYSIWREDSDPPEGWRRVTGALSEQECLDWIGEIWVDIRPLSARTDDR